MRLSSVVPRGGRLIGLPLLLLAGFGIGQEAVLEVTTGSTVIHSLSLACEAAWIIRWNHSVTGVTVSDYYRWDGSSLLLTDTHTPSFDAGLGHIPGRGRLEGDESGYWIFDIDEPVPGNAYALRVGSARVNHRIVHNGEVYSLSEVAANTRVRIGVVVK